MTNFIKTIYCLAIFSIVAVNLQAQTIGSVTTASTSCKITVSSCDGDTLTLTPQDQVSYTNYKWYRTTVSVGNEITAANAAANNVVAAGFVGNFPSINVVSGGGTYILTAEYATPAGCATKNDTFELNFTPLPTANPATLTLCASASGGNTADFTLSNADATVTGGATGVTVTYHATQADARNDASPLSSPYTSASATIYARVENNTTGCYRTVAITLTVNPKPVIADAATTICNGASVDLTSLITSYASYANPVWTLTTVGGTSVSSPAAVTPSVTTTYILVAENGNACKDTANVVVTVNPNPDFTLVKPTACPGTSEEVNITNLTNAVVATAQYKIDAGTYAAYPTPAILTGLAVGNHTVTVKNAEGCETPKSVTISSVPAQICLPVTVTRQTGNN